MRRRWILTVILAGFVALAVAARRGREREVRTAIRPVNLAHRGASAEFPENTVASFRAAVAAGARGLELDVHMTRDGHVVVIHDETVDRTTNGSSRVGDLTLEKLQALDAGYRFRSKDGATYPYRGCGFRVPTLSEVFRSFPKTSVNLDIKESRPGIEASVLRVIERARAEDRALVASLSYGVLRRFRKLSGGRISTGASRPELAIFYLVSRIHLEGLLRPRYDAVQIPVRHRGIELATRRFVEAAHRCGVRVDVWTIDDPVEMRRVLDLGVDAVMTNRPRELAEVLAGRR